MLSVFSTSRSSLRFFSGLSVLLCFSFNFFPSDKGRKYKVRGGSLRAGEELRFDGGQLYQAQG